MLEQIINEYLETAHPDERLGQWFVNGWIKQPWPELYYETSNIIAMVKINQYLNSLQYDKLPPRIDEIV